MTTVSTLDPLPSELELIGCDPDLYLAGTDVSFVAAGRKMQEVLTRLRLVAAVEVPVLVLGETGTGKEVVARLIHKFSGRSSRTFFRVNCAAVPNELLESELFGYEAGAFTGAARPKPGQFELSNGGTLLLDEIGEMPTHLQAKLLHVLQDGTFSRLGGRSNVTVDCRIIAATNIDIPRALSDRRLREDLYYRLNAFTLTLPPLRERREELPVLLRYFMSRFAREYEREPLPISRALDEACAAYPWPGNVRQLANFVRRYLILGDEGLALNELVSVYHGASDRACALSEAVAGGDKADLKSLVRGLKHEVEAEAIVRALEQAGWKQLDAANLLRISSRALRYKMVQYGIRLRRGRGENTRWNSPDVPVASIGHEIEA